MLLMVFAIIMSIINLKLYYICTLLHRQVVNTKKDSSAKKEAAVAEATTKIVTGAIVEAATQTADTTGADQATGGTRF